MSVLIYTESPLAPADAAYRRVIPAGDFWMHEIKAGQTLRILDLEGNQAADTAKKAAQNEANRRNREAGIEVTDEEEMIASRQDNDDGEEAA
jgi:uncharacterized protein YcgI (DUF1989 family)